MAPDSVWEIVFLMVILKIPIVYLVWVVWWAIRAEPKPEEGAGITAVLGPDDPPGRRRGRRRLGPPRLPRPHGGPARTYARTARAAASARAR
ncbi:MAG TPA: hypothetical protein VH416_04105 [Gaiellaceae bacterium]